MNKVHRISLNYLAVLMLVIANLLPAASVFAEGLTKPGREYLRLRILIHQSRHQEK